MGKKPATYQDVVEAPEATTAELIGGELFLTPRPAVGHAHTAFAAASELGPRFQRASGGPGGWVLLVEPELWLGPPDEPNAEVLVPDLAGWERRRFQVPRTHGHTVRPDWVCEILSPTTARRDRVVKLAVYARQGIGHTWIVDPTLETIEVYALRDDVYALVATAAGDDEARLPPFHAVALPLEAWWIRSLEAAEE